MEKKPMSVRLASQIRRNLPLIEEDVETNDLHTYLIADSVIDFNDKETISKAGTRKERASCLVSLLLKRGDKAYYCFLEALRKANYTHVVEKISGHSSHSNDNGAGAAPDNLVPVPLEKKVANLEEQTSKHKMKLKSLSERLNKVETKEEVNIIEQEFINLQNAESDEEQEIKKLRTEVRMKEDELASLAEKTSAQISLLEAEIASLKQKAEKGEQELQQYKQEKAELESKLKALMLSTDEQFRKITEEAKASNAKIRQLEDSRQEDANAHDAKMKELEKKMVQMIESMTQGPSAPTSQQKTEDPKTLRSPAPSNEPSIKPAEPKVSSPEIEDTKSPGKQLSSSGPSNQSGQSKAQGPTNQKSSAEACSPSVTKTQRRSVPNIQPAEREIRGPNSQRQQQSSTGSSTQMGETKAQVLKTPRSLLSLKEPYIQLPEPKESNPREKPC